MVSTNGVQTVVHSSQGMNGTLCVHILFPSPHIHYRVVTVEPGHILAIVHSSCKKVNTTMCQTTCSAHWKDEAYVFKTADTGVSLLQDRLVKILSFCPSHRTSTFSELVHYRL